MTHQRRLPAAGRIEVTLRDYQQAAVDSIYSWFEGHDGNPLIVVPTGGGKSVIIAAFIRDVLVNFPEDRILVATHVRELVAQNHDQMLRLWHEAPVGIYSAGLGRRDTRASVLFASVQSVYQRAQEIGSFDLVLVDEAHLIPAKGFGMYRTLLHDLREMQPKAKLIGFTATPFRTDAGRLDAGDERMFHGTAYSCDMLDLIERGFLCRVVNQGVDHAVDTRGVAVRGGEFVEGELEKAAMRGDLVEQAVDELCRRASDRRSWLVFGCGVAHARAIQARLIANGISAATVFGTTSSEQRAKVLRDFKAGSLRAVVNVGVLTTGFDAPATDAIALLRPTQSPGLYVQMVGRGMRVAEGKTDCLILDFGENVMRHGPINDVKVRQPGKGTGEPPMATCPSCKLIVPVMTVTCPRCGTQLRDPNARKTPDHGAMPDSQSVLLTPKKQPIERWKPDRVIYAEHQKDPAKPPTMRVTYLFGYRRTANEFICFEHPAGSFPRKKAEMWWKARGGAEPVPHTVDLARCRIECGALRRVTTVIVKTTGEYPEVRGVELEPSDPERKAIQMETEPVTHDKGTPDELPF